ncbi:MAG: pyridoxamine kinase [Lachnospiraceae bacterium]|nr:pyridoxamine kinase [Lachnospiraceae bacterium]
MYTPTPRLAMLNSFAGFGRISTTVALPIISVMQVQVCPIPTSVLSNHLAFPVCTKQDFTEHILPFLQTWEELNLRFDGFYCGYLSNREQMESVEYFLNSKLLKEDASIIIDPVMGDAGKPYRTVTPEHIAQMKELVKQAHLITPNLTELCLLTDTPYTEEGWTTEKLTSLCASLDTNNQKQIVVTGIENAKELMVFIWNKCNISEIRFPSAGDSRHGTGDIFASILSANALKQVPLETSVKQAVDFISACIRDSEEAGLPILDGVLFEQNLSRLL